VPSLAHCSCQAKGSSSFAFSPMSTSFGPADANIFEAILAVVPIATRELKRRGAPSFATVTSPESIVIRNSMGEIPLSMSMGWIRFSFAWCIVSAQLRARFAPCSGGAPPPFSKYAISPSPVFFSTVPPYSSTVLTISVKSRFREFNSTCCSADVSAGRLEKPQISKNMTAI